MSAGVVATTAALMMLLAPAAHAGDIGRAEFERWWSPPSMIRRFDPSWPT